MAADMHLHILDAPNLEVDEEIVRKFIRKELPDEEEWENAYFAINHTPNVWVGEVSWVKAQLFNDDGYIPPAVGKIQELVGETFPVIDDQFLANVESAMLSANHSAYGTTSALTVLNFLRRFMGHRCFVVSW